MASVHQWVVALAEWVAAVCKQLTCYEKNEVPCCRLADKHIFRWKR